MENLETMIKEELQELIKNETRLLIVKLGATWCSPCKTLSKVLHNLDDDRKSKINIISLDIEEDMDTCSLFAPVSGVPIMIFFKNGKEVHKEIGLNGFSHTKHITGLIDSLL